MPGVESAGSPGSLVTAIHEVAGSGLLLGVEDLGLCRWSGTSFEVVVPASVTGRIRTISKGMHGGLWIGTDRGLSAYVGKEFRRVVLDLLIPVVDIVSVVEDEIGDLWLGHKNGVLRLRSGNGLLGLRIPAVR